MISRMLSPAPTHHKVQHRPVRTPLALQKQKCRESHLERHKERVCAALLARQGYVSITSESCMFVTQLDAAP